MITIFQAGTKINPEEVMNNFYHIGQGDLLPRGGASLDPTTSVYDLGSSAIRYITTYAETIHARQSQTMEIITDVNISTTSSTIEITGLNGDTNEIYEIQFFSNQAIGNLVTYVAINGDTSTANYIQLLNTVYPTGTIRVNYTKGFYTGYGNDTTTAGLNNYSNIVMIAQTGKKRSAITDFNTVTDATSKVSAAYICSGIWKNTTDTITSLVFHTNTTTANFAAGTTIRILSRGRE